MSRIRFEKMDNNGERFEVEILGRKFRVTSDSYGKAKLTAAHLFNEEMDSMGELIHKVGFLVANARCRKLRLEDV